MKYIKTYENKIVLGIINDIQDDTIINLHSFGYTDANINNIYTDKIFSFHYKNMLENKLNKKGDMIDTIIFHLLSHIKTLTQEDKDKYELLQNVKKYNI